MCARFTVLNETPMAAAIAGCIMPLSRSNTIWMSWRCASGIFHRSAVLSSRICFLVHLTIRSPESDSQSESHHPMLCTGLPQIPQFNQFWKRYEMLFQRVSERHQGWRPHRWHQLCKPIRPIAALDINLQVDPQHAIRSWRFPGGRWRRHFSALPQLCRAGWGAVIANAPSCRNHNHLLGQVEGLDGIKTGYTKASGFNLVTSVRRNNRHIVSVVLGGASAGARDARMRSLIEEYIVAASPQKSATATAEAREEPVETRVRETRLHEAHVAAPSTKGTHVSDARPANQPTEPAIYSVASYERPPLSSAASPSSTPTTTAEQPFAGRLADTIAPASAAVGKHVPLASDPIRPIPINYKTVNVKLAPPFGTLTYAQIEVPEVSGDDPASPQSKAPPQPPFKPQLTQLPQNAGVLGMLLSPEQSARDDMAPPLSATPQSDPHRAAPSGAAAYSGWSIQLFWTGPFEMAFALVPLALVLLPGAHERRRNASNAATTSAY
jgi:hypothetical protein